ncbi:MAG: N-acetyltransferase [Alphaproteobacteria bacterium]
MSGISPIPADAEHAPMLARLHSSAFPSPWSADEISALLRQDAVIGLTLPQISMLLIRHAAGEAEILTLATDTRHLRQGHAASLLRHAIDMLQDKQVTRLFLEVATGNTAARALYEALGFIEVGRRPGYYAAQAGGSRQDALILSLDLEAACAHTRSEGEP